MVAVCVAEDKNIKAAKSARPEIRGHDLFADIEAAGRLCGFGHSADGAACIDQHRRAVRAYDEDGVTLSYVDGCDLHHVA